MYCTNEIKFKLISMSKVSNSCHNSLFSAISATIFVTTATVKVKQITDYYAGLYFCLIIQLKEIGGTNFLYLAWYVKRMVKNSRLRSTNARVDRWLVSLLCLLMRIRTERYNIDYLNFIKDHINHVYC